MSQVYVSFIDRKGQKGSTRFYCLDDEDFLVFLDRIKDHLISCASEGYHILRVEVT